MKRFLIILMLATTTIVLGCFAAPKKVKGSGITVTQTRNITGYTGIRTSAGIDIYVTQGNSFSMQITADKNLMPYVKTSVANGVLSIGYDNINAITNKIKTIVKITAPKINSLSASSSGDIIINGILTSNDLSMSSSSSGDIKGIVECSGNLSIKTSSSGDITLKAKAENCSMKSSSSGDIKVSIMCNGELSLSCSSSGDIEVVANTNSCKANTSSSGDIKVKGKASSCSAVASSSGNIYFDEFECKAVTASASSSSLIKVLATDSLNASASSSGSIIYSGNPKTTNFKKSSGGSIKKY